MSASSTRTPTDGLKVARYSISAGEGVLYGQRVDGIVRVVEKPAQDGAGRSFLVERGLTSQAELEALVADYLRQSVERDEPAALVRVADDLALRARKVRRHA